MEHQQSSQVTDRAPLENEIVIVAEEGLPRAEWKLGKVEKLHKNRGGKTKAVDVKMPNGHVLKRPVSMLYPLEVSEEERETLSTTKSKEFVKHLADQNLQAEETEEEEESKTTRTMYAHALSVIEITTKRDREITEEWALVTEEKEPVFDAPPFTDISKERLQWVLDMIDKNRRHKICRRSAEEQGKSTADAIRDDAEVIIEAASDACQKSSAALTRELEDVAFRWRWIIGGAVGAALAVRCAAAAIFLCLQYLLCAARCCCVRC
uniref:DUF5641 domain-containing protein n=1 Tax=Parascaris univalens TaxID=6257 RepID=A0A914ZHM9_PARUN